MPEANSLTVAELQKAGLLLVQDGNHGESRPRPGEFVESGVAFIRAADMSDGRILFDRASRINDVAVKRITKGIGRAGDVLLSHKGTVGKVALAGEDAPPFVCSPQTTFWRTLDENQIDRSYLYVFLRSPSFHQQLDSRAAETDMAPYVSLTSQRGLRVILPAIEDQRAIGELIGALDQKVELNRKMNETLETMARSIFRDWFVDFGPTLAKMEGRAPYLAPDLWALFSDQLDNEGKPVGWSIQPLDQLADFLNGLALQKFPPTGFNDLPVIKIAELRKGISANSNTASRDIPARYIIEDGDILFSWSGSLTQVIWTGGQGALNQHLFKVSSAQNPKWLHYFWVDYYLPQFQAIAASKATTMGHIQRHHLTEAPVVLGDGQIMKAASKIIAPLFAKLVANSLENRALAATRDMLLPKLMSGEIRVCDAEAIVADAA